MDNHPIPQDVTHFQFQLIGNMTIKQFAYLGTGAIIGWICFSLPIFLLLKIPLAAFFAGSGVFLAFAPIEGRSADIMVTNFIKAIFAPTIYTYQNITLEQDKSTVTVTPIPVEKKEEIKEKKDQTVMFQSPVLLKKTDMSEVKPVVIQTPAPVTQEQAMRTENTIVAKATALQQAVLASKKEEMEHHTDQELSLSHDKTIELENQLRSILEQKTLLEQQLLQMQKQIIQTPSQQPMTPTATIQPGAPPRVVKVPKNMTTAVGVPLTPDVPNLITGVVKDPRGNVISNILVEVRDKDNNPVRAFKTNSLGQFASATPLNNGTYTLMLEDPNGKNSFDIIEIVASGDIIFPLQITSIDQRELLRKELFNT